MEMTKQLSNKFYCRVLKMFNYRLLACMLLLCNQAYPQWVEGNVKKLKIGYSKTSSLVFPVAIKSIDKGSRDILAQRAKEVANVLFIKAGIKNFVQTNLTVITADGKLYVFVLDYNEANPDLSLSLSPEKGSNSEIMLHHQQEKEIRQYAELALNKIAKIGGFKRYQYQMELRITGLFIHRDMIYIRLKIWNDSNMDYDIDQIRFFVHDRSQSSSTASQEIEIVPLLNTTMYNRIADHSEVLVVYVLPKFSISARKFLSIQLLEKTGDRQLQLDVKSIDLLNMKILSSF